MTVATHRTEVLHTNSRWFWWLTSLRDGAVVKSGQCDTEADATDAAVEAGHSLGLYTIDRTNTNSALMGKATA